jgi:hypothetical protein
MSTGNWYPARVLILIVGMLLEIDPLFCLFIKINQLKLEISSSMPISSNNSLAACQLLEDI